MTLKRLFVRFLDRPGGRNILGLFATRQAQRITGTDIEIFHNGIWAFRYNKYCYPLDEVFNYYAGSYQNMITYADNCIINAHDYWYKYYVPREGDIIVDVGAGKGEDVAAFSQDVGKSGRVIAIEADPQTFTCLEHLCRLNRLSTTTALWCALMGKSGTVSLVESKQWEANEVRWDQSGLSSTTVPAFSLDMICEREGIKDIDFLKMNIEGAEREALAGMESSIKRIRHICIACHDFRAERGHGEYFRTRKIVEAFLEHNGFTIHSRDDDERDFVRDHVYGINGALTIPVNNRTT